MTEPALCSERVDRSGSSRWSNFQPCGRPAVKDGLCKLHLRARDNRQQKRREWAEKEARGAALCDEAERLSEQLGVRVTANYSWASKSYTGQFTVPGDWLREIASKMESRR